MFKISELVFYINKSKELMLKKPKENDENSALFCSLDKMERVIKRLRNDGVEMVPFNYTILSCFPGAIKVMEEQWQKEFTKGYIQGVKDGSKQ